MFFTTKRIPIFCYHSLTVNGTQYHENDHIAMESDLAELKNRGYKPISVEKLVDFIQGKCSITKKEKVFVLTFDDAPYWDYHDYSDDIIGHVKSFNRIVKESGLFTQHDVMPMSFAIASEAARTALDKTCIAGRDEWNSRWWQQAIKEGYMEIGCHSWDHLHPSLENVQQRQNLKGNFALIDTYQDADVQIRQANEKIKRITCENSCPYFAYPYGHASDYLRDEYFPKHQSAHHIQAAFATGGRFATKQDTIWAIPRLVCGEHWKTPEEFIDILNKQRVSTKTESHHARYRS